MYRITKRMKPGRKGVGEKGCGEQSAILVCSPAFSASLRRGISLLEVLAAIGVLSIGLLGLAALLPVGRYTIAEATKADRAGDCGRAALREIMVRRMLDSNYWTANPGTASFVIDPRGVVNGLAKFGLNLPRISLTYANSQALADAIFIATDDLIVPLPEEMNPPQPVGRPLAALNFKGDFSWFLTVVPVPNNPTRFTVSAVVCHKRDFVTEATATVAAADFYDAGLSGGSIKISAPSAPFEVKENDWIALCGTNQAKPIPIICRWYRVASVADDGVSLTLVGPDWDTSYATTAVSLGQSVLGVYTSTVDLDTDPTWKN